MQVQTVHNNTADHRCLLGDGGDDALIGCSQVPSWGPPPPDHPPPRDCLSRKRVLRHTCKPASLSACVLPDCAHESVYDSVD